MTPVLLLAVALAAPPDLKPLVRLGDTRLRHTGNVTSLALAPDGKTLVAHSTRERSARAWDAATGRELRKLAEPRFTRDVTRVVGFTPDGRRVLVLNDDEECVVLRYSDGEELLRFGAKAVAAISPDGSHAVGVGVYDEVKAWALADGTPRFALGGFGDADKVAAAFSPDGKRVAVAGANKSIAIHRLADGVPDHVVKDLGKAVDSLGWHPDGALYAVVGTDVVRVADKPGATGGTLLAGFRGLALPADGRRTLLIGAATSKVRSFAPDLKGQVSGFDGPTVPTDGRVAVSAGGTAFAVSDGPLVRVYDAATGSPLTAGLVDGTAVDHLTASADGSRLLAVGERLAVLWDVAAGKPLHAWTPDAGRFTRGALSPDGRYAVALRSHNDARCVVWDTRSGAKVFQEAHESGNGKGISYLIGFDPAGRLWVGDHKGPEVRVIELPSGAVRHRLKSFTDCWDGTLTPDGRTLMVSGWEALATRPTDPDADWAVHARFGGFPANRIPRPGEPLPFPLRQTLSPNGRFAAGGMGQDILAWDVRRPGKRLRFAEAMPKSIDFVGGLAFTPDSRRLAWTKGTDDTAVRLWEVGTWAEVFRFAPADRVRAFAFSADGKRIAVAHPDGTLSVWDAAAVEVAFFDPPDVPAGDVWESLGSPDPAVGLAVVRHLAARPADALVLFRARFANADASEVAALVADLDSPVYAVRSKATRTLTAVGEPAEGAVRRALDTTASAEVRARAELILKQFEVKRGQLSPALLRGVRAVEVLERIGTPEVVELLKLWATGEPSALRAQDAAAAAARLARK